MPRFKPYEPKTDNYEKCPVSGKRMFENEPEAQREADWKRSREGIGLGVYHCMSCGAWHLTSTH